MAVVITDDKKRAAVVDNESIQHKTLVIPVLNILLMSEIKNTKKNYMLLIYKIMIKKIK